MKFAVAVISLLIMVLTTELEAGRMAMGMGRGGVDTNTYGSRRCRGRSRGRYSSKLYHNKIRCRLGYSGSRNRGPGGMAVGLPNYDENNNNNNNQDYDDEDQEAPCIGICYMLKMQREAAQKAQQDKEIQEVQEIQDNQEIQKAKERQEAKQRLRQERQEAKERRRQERRTEKERKQQERQESQLYSQRAQVELERQLKSQKTKATTLGEALDDLEEDKDKIQRKEVKEIMKGFKSNSQEYSKDIQADEGDTLGERKFGSESFFGGRPGSQGATKPCVGICYLIKLQMAENEARKNQRKRNQGALFYDDYYYQ